MICTEKFSPKIKRTIIFTNKAIYFSLEIENNNGMNDKEKVPLKRYYRTLYFDKNFCSEI